MTTTHDILRLAHEAELLADEIDLADDDDRRAELGERLDALLLESAQAVPDKLDALRATAKRFDALAGVHKAEEHSQARRRRSAERTSARCRQLAEDLVRRYGTTTTTTAKYRLHPSNRRVVGPNDDDAWADQGWIIVKEQPDRKAALASLAALGEDEWPDGFRIEQGDHLRW